MGNCLKSQLKESVNNPSLKKYGVLELEVKTVTITSSYYNMLTIKTNADTVIKTKDGSNKLSRTSAGLSDPTNEIPITANTETYIYTVNDNYFVEISDKYTITKLEVNGNGYSSCNINLEDFEWLTSLYHFTAINQTSKGNIASLKNLVNMEKLDVSSSKIIGNITDVASMTLLNILNVSYTSISGEIEDFADAMATSPNNRTSGTMRIYCNSYINLNGSALNNNTTKWVKFGTNLPAGAEVTGTGWAVYATNPDA